jgi:hypothetical protein
MGPQRRGELDWANLNRRRAATVRRLDRCLVTVRAASGEDSAPSMCAKACGEKLRFGGYIGFGGFLTCGQKFALWAALYIGVFRYDHSRQGL